MDEYEKKILEEAVEKVIDEREKRQAVPMKPLPTTEKKNLAKESSSPVKKNKMKHVDLVLAAIFIAGVLIYFGWPSIMPGETEPVIVYPANVVLDSFDDTISGSLYMHVIPLGQPGGFPITVESSDGCVSVSFELKNTGDEDATDVSCFIKCCDQDGTILFAQLFTFGDIGSDMTGKIPASGNYHVPISNETLYITHSIDVRWSPQGVNTYVKLTEV